MVLLQLLLLLQLRRLLHVGVLQLHLLVELRHLQLRRLVLLLLLKHDLLHRRSLHHGCGGRLRVARLRRAAGAAVAGRRGAQP